MKTKTSVKKVIALLTLVVMLFGIMPNISALAASTGVPGKATLQHDQWGGDTDGDFNITVNMWYGNNGTSYKLYEKIGKSGEYKVVETGELTDGSPSPQSFVISVKGRETKGVYYYYLELINSFGSTNTDEMTVNVGSIETHPILIDTVDDEEAATQFTVEQGVTEFKLSHSKTANSKFSVVSSNMTTVKASIVDGNILRVEGLDAGRSGLKITEETSGDIRYVGCRVRKANGSLPGLPNYVTIGQVSEDTKNDLDFWKDIDTDDTNKRVDIRYIYVNGGPINPWGSWNQNNGQRVRSYINESRKLGIIPYFVFYNIPNDAEDYNTDLNHINDTEYMEAYYKDLQLFLDIINELAADDTVGIILEPDFLGYMMQQSGKQPNEIVAAGVEMAYSSGVLVKGVDPNFDNTVQGLVQSINYIINKNAPQTHFGWQFNTWAYPGQGVPGTGLMHATETMGWDAGRSFIAEVAQKTAQFYIDAGVTTYGADFISIDKYGLDGAFQSGAAQDPESSMWFWNSDMWNNYLHYTKTLHETTNLPVTLWQLPVGHINSSLESNPYTGGLFKDLDNSDMHLEDSAPTFFFGDTFTPGAGNRYNYFAKNAANDPKVTSNGNTVTYGSHIEEAKAAGVDNILFGAGVGRSTDAVGSPPTEDYWWITKAQRYYKNPVSLDRGNDDVTVYEKEDVNKDGKITILDLSMVASAYNAKSGSNNWKAAYDVNGDNIIDIYDLVKVAKKISA